jgi:hypothetical protein
MNHASSHSPPPPPPPPTTRCYRDIPPHCPPPPPRSSQAVDVQFSPPWRQLPAIWGGVSEHQGGTARVLAGVVGHLLDGGVAQVGVAGGAGVPGGVCNDGVQRRP